MVSPTVGVRPETVVHTPFGYPSPVIKFRRRLVDKRPRDTGLRYDENSRAHLFHEVNPLSDRADVPVIEGLRTFLVNRSRLSTPVMC